jgi:hypothetical protein
MRRRDLAVRDAPERLLTRQGDTLSGGQMDRNTGTPVGFALLLTLVVAFGWVVWGGHRHSVGSGDASLASYASAGDLAAAQAQPALVWPDAMPEPMTSYVGRRVSAFGLKVTSVDADEGFWVQKGNRRAWIQLQTATESPYTVRVGDTVSLSGQVLTHNPDFPSQIFFCPDRYASRAELSNVPTHLAVRVDALSFGVG